jgi:hypothetical protein
MITSEDPAVTIRRLRQRLYIVEPVYRAAVAAYKVGGRRTQAGEERIERAVDHALDTERMIAEGGSISDLDLEGVCDGT